MNRLSLYTVFHLNLSYSSLEASQRPVVIERCYWPLLELASGPSGVPLGLEVTGFTLEQLAEHDPAWVLRLRELLEQGRCELIGSGYAQLIGPLVPAVVNRANLALGLEGYAALLGGWRPRIALVGEQAFSAGLVPLFLEAGYEAIVMEWNNPASSSAGWSSTTRYLPQRALGAGPDETVPLLWNDSIAFQKVQRYAHGELELSEVIDFLAGHASRAPAGGCFPLYGNDAEVFGFRPGRYETEAPLDAVDEWARLAGLLRTLAADPRFELLLPARALDSLALPGAGQALSLTTAAVPVPVKKQAKYNLTRWAVTGRDDLGLNTACHRVLRGLIGQAGGAAAKPWEADRAAWRRLCQLWASDLRTHITPARWSEALGELRGVGPLPVPAEGSLRRPAAGPAPTFRRQGRWLDVETEGLALRLNCRRGLTIEALTFKEVAAGPLLGTVPHGYFEDISLGADFYTGHTLVEIPGRRRVTDLEPVEPRWELSADGSELVVSGEVITPLGPVLKAFTLSTSEPSLTMQVSLPWHECPAGAVRTCFVTFLPWAFDGASLRYWTHNGGERLESFALEPGQEVLHPEPASALVSAQHGLGATEGVVIVGDERALVTLSFDPALAAAMPMILFRHRQGQWLLRALFSLGEIDETRRFGGAPGSSEILGLPGWSSGGVSLCCRLTAARRLPAE